jgi:hypothetical protein
MKLRNDEKRAQRREIDDEGIFVAICSLKDFHLRGGVEGVSLRLVRWSHRQQRGAHST